MSDGAAAGTRDDTSGPAVAAFLAERSFVVVECRVVPDGTESVTMALKEMTEGFAGLVVTTGGTGFAPRDLTPEATAAVLDRQAPGLAEAMRATSPFGRLSRGVAGTVGASIVVNVPGSERGALECIAAIIDVVPHALALLTGDQGGH